MTANFQLSGKDAAGRIIVIGGNTYPEFATNLAAFVDDDQAADSIISSLKGTLGIGGAPAAPSFEQAAQNVTNGFPPPPQSQPAQGNVGPNCNHGQPRKYRQANPNYNKPPQWICQAVPAKLPDGSFNREYCRPVDA